MNKRSRTLSEARKRLRSRKAATFIRFAAIITFAVSLIGGCEKAPSPVAQTDQAAAAAVENKDTVPPTGGIELPPLDELEKVPDNSSSMKVGIELPPFDESGNGGDQTSDESSNGKSLRIEPWAETLETIRGPGIYVVDLWSLSCPPCMAEFPGLVRLHAASGNAAPTNLSAVDSFGPNKVHCIAVSLDYDGRKSRPPNWYREKVAKFLESVDSGDLPVVISSTPSDEVLGSIDADSIPTVLVYQDGTLVQKFVDAGEKLGFNYDDDVMPLVQSLAR